MGALQCGWAKSNLLIMVGGENMGISSNVRERATEVAVVMLEGGRWWTAFRD
jgi:tRNA G18 (ribose-2'-O)-methylase SpoU